jgi:proline iminopeptidase
MYLHANGTRLFFDVVGSELSPREAAMQPKPTLLVLHGGPGLDHSYFRPNLDPLGDDAQVLYLDLRGQGRSARHRHEYYQVSIMADDVVALCAELGIEKPIVLGHSFGGYVALTMAMHFPDLLGGLILVSTAPVERGYDLDTLEQLAGKDLREVAAHQQTGEASEEDMQRFLTEVFPLYWYQFKPEYLSGIFGKTVLNLEIGPYMQARLKQEYDLRSQVAGITTPTLVLLGLHDWVTPFKEGEAMARQIPNARLHVFEQSGHWVFDDQPQEFIAVTRTFLASGLNSRE